MVDTNDNMAIFNWSRAVLLGLIYESRVDEDFFVCTYTACMLKMIANSTAEYVRFPRNYDNSCKNIGWDGYYEISEFVGKVLETDNGMLKENTKIALKNMFEVEEKYKVGIDNLLGNLKGTSGLGGRCDSLPCCTVVQLEKYFIPLLRKFPEYQDIQGIGGIMKTHMKKELIRHCGSDLTIKWLGQSLVKQSELERFL